MIPRRLSWELFYQSCSFSFFSLSSERGQGEIMTFELSLVNCLLIPSSSPLLCVLYAIHENFILMDKLSLNII